MARSSLGGSLLNRPVVLLLMFAVAVLIAASFAGTSWHNPVDSRPDPTVTLGELQTGRRVWSPDYERLAERVAAFGFPPLGDASYHADVQLKVYLDGELIEVPRDIGIDDARRFTSPLHTHRSHGVVHLEADDPYPFTLGQIFAVWGVDFGPGRLGEFRDAPDKKVQVYVNGRRIADFVNQPLADRDNVVVAYGTAGSFPTEPRTVALDAEA